jgi:hypothetical protein
MTERHTLTPNVMLQHHHIEPLTNFKFSDFNKEPTNSLMMIETCWSVLSVLILTYWTNIVVYISALVGI